MQDCVPALLPTLIEPLLFPIQVFPKQARSCLAEKKNAVSISLNQVTGMVLQNMWTPWVSIHKKKCRQEDTNNHPPVHQWMSGAWQGGHPTHLTWQWPEGVCKLRNSRWSCASDPTQLADSWMNIFFKISLENIDLWFGVIPCTWSFSTADWYR